jgi:hypothetical protein
VGSRREVGAPTALPRQSQLKSTITPTAALAIADVWSAVRVLSDAASSLPLQRYADYCPNPGERDVVEAAFARGTNRGTNPRAPVRD